MVKVARLASELDACGHSIEVVTTFPNYPLGRIYDGWLQRMHHIEDDDGVTVHRVPLFPDHSRSAVRRVLSYVSFGAMAGLLGKRITQKPDLVWAYHPPLPTLWAAASLARRYKVPFTMEIQDMWPETLRASGMVNSERVISMVNRSCNRMYRKATAISVISAGFRENLLAKGVSREKVHVIPNWADPERYPVTAANPKVAKREGFECGFNVIFAGNMGIFQHLETVVRSAILLKGLPAIQFTFIGDGVDEDHLKRLVAHERLDNVRFLGRRDESEMAALLAHADALLIHLRRDPLFAITIPSKTLAYLAAGRPIIAAVEGDAAAVVEQAGAGISCTPEDPEELAAAIRELYNLPERKRIEMGRRGRECFEERFTPKKIVPHYEQMFRQALDAPQHIGKKGTPAVAP